MIKVNYLFLNLNAYTHGVIIMFFNLKFSAFIVAFIQKITWQCPVVFTLCCDCFNH